MANSLYFLAHSKAEPVTMEREPNSCLLASNYIVPILWIALFDDADLAYVDEVSTDADDKEVIHRMPTLLAPQAKARATYAARRTGLAHALGGTHAHTIAEWEAFLALDLGESHFQLDFNELWWMYDNLTMAHADLLEWLEGVATQSNQGWYGLCHQAYLEDPDVSRYGLRGASWDARVKLD